MRHHVVSQFEKRPEADLLIIPVYKDSSKKEAFKWPRAVTSLKKSYDAPIDLGDFKGDVAETVLQYAQNGKEARVILVGLGKEKSATVETLRRACSAAMKAAMRIKAKSINILIPDTLPLSKEELIRGVSEGLFLSHYLFDKHKGKTLKGDSSARIGKITVVTDIKNAEALLDKAFDICEGVYFARDLVNGNADDVTPEHLASCAKQLAKANPNLKTTIFDKKRLEKDGFGLLLAVGRASHNEPVLIICEYKGAPKSKKHTVIVGKGVTFDTGGLNLKPTGSMETMKCDMGGAAAALGTILAVSKLKLKCNLTVVIPAAENSIAAESYKPGDIYTGYAGKSVEVANTDAEGRLILADALAYAVDKLKPTEIIDVATLTGAIEIALGNEVTGFFSNNEALAESLTKAGMATFERVWRMPLFEEYRDLLRSDIADIRNHGGRGGGAITAAIFLKEFIGDTPWAHLDIAGTAFINDAKRYHPKFGTGIGVRLLVEHLEGQ